MNLSLRWTMAELDELGLGPNDRPVFLVGVSVC